MKATVFLTKEGLFEASDIDRKKGMIGGYKLFPEFGKSNPYRTFWIVDVQIKTLSDNGKK